MQTQTLLGYFEGSGGGVSPIETLTQIPYSAFATWLAPLYCLYMCAPILALNLRTVQLLRIAFMLYA